jgi:hypothetical protein
MTPEEFARWERYVEALNEPRPLGPVGIRTRRGRRPARGRRDLPDALSGVSVMSAPGAVDVVICVRPLAPRAGHVRVVPVSGRACDLLGYDQEVPPQEWKAIRTAVECRGWTWVHEEEA